MWHELGFHCGAIFLVENAVDGTKEEGKCEQDSRHKGEVEAGGDAFIQPGAGDGVIHFTIALYKHHGCSLVGGAETLKQWINGRSNVISETTVHFRIQLQNAHLLVKATALNWH